MSSRARVRLALAAAAGLAAGGAGWTRIAPLDPFVDVRVSRAAAGTDVWKVEVTARGGAIDEVRVEPAAGPLRVEGDSSVRGLAGGRTATFTFRLEDPARLRGCAVRVHHAGRSSGTADLPLEERP